MLNSGLGLLENRRERFETGRGPNRDGRRETRIIYPILKLPGGRHISAQLCVAQRWLRDSNLSRAAAPHDGDDDAGAQRNGDTRRHRDGRGVPCALAVDATRLGASRVEARTRRSGRILGRGESTSPREPRPVDVVARPRARRRAPSGPRTAPGFPRQSQPRTRTRRRGKHRRVRPRHQGAPQGPHVAWRRQLLVPRHGAFAAPRSISLVLASSLNPATISPGT